MATALTEFKLTNENFNEDELMCNIGNISDVEGGLMINSAFSESECDLIEASIFKKLTDSGDKEVERESTELAQLIYERVGRYCTYELKKKNPSDLSEILNLRVDSVRENFKFNIYGTGDKFVAQGEKKFDEKYSLYSIVIFTNGPENNSFTGGEFRFYKKDAKSNLIEAIRVQPSKGLCLVFPHCVPHDNLPVESGSKHTITAEVLYGKAVYEEFENYDGEDY